MLKGLFPIFAQHPKLVYLDTAATAQKPQVVIDAMNQFLGKQYGTVHRALYQLSAHSTELYNDVRESVRQFIGANFLEEIIFTKGATDAINLAASSFGRHYLEEQDEVLVLETEHHSNLVPWQMICNERKAILRPIPVNDRGEVDLNVLESLMHDKVKLIAIAHVSNATGAIHPIADVVKIARRYRTKVFVDGAQSVCHFPISVSAMDVDFFAFSAHKMYGPTGVGVLYGKKEILEQMPPYQGGGDMVEKVSFTKTVYQPIPLKFEAGTPNIVGVIGLGAAMKFLSEIGMNHLGEIEAELFEYAKIQLSTISGLNFLCSPRKATSLISFNCEGCHPMDIGTLLDSRGICVRTGHLCAQTALERFQVSSTIRISFGIYNTKEDVDLLVSALREIIRILR